MKMLQHKFVDFIPDDIENKVLYISIKYCTAIHKCVCGCGNEVVTPISPTDWKLTFNGKAVSLHPSIGNWNFDCQSHYWIRNNKIQFAGKWTKSEIREGRNNDLKEKKFYFEELEAEQESIIQEKLPTQKQTIWEKLLAFFGL